MLCAGQVYKSVLKKVQPVAVKHIKGIPTNGTKYAREVALLKDLRSPHIIQFLGATTIVSFWRVQQSCLHAKNEEE